MPPKKETIKERILSYVADHGGEIDVTECAEDLGLSKTEVKETIELLQREGKVEKEVEAGPLESTAIRSAGYDYKSKVLELEFQTGGTYQYFDIPADVYEALMEAPSPGRFFHQNIKGTYPSERVGMGARQRVSVPRKRLRGVVGHLNCPYCGRELAIEEGEKYYRCPCGKKLELLRSRLGIAHFFRGAPRLINRTCPNCGEWAVYAEQTGLPHGYKRWVCRNCGYVVGSGPGLIFSGVGTPEWEGYQRRMAESRAKKWWECFIATAAFGDPLARELEVLRRFRDTVLLRGRIGSEIVSIYYRLSPPIAELIRDNQRMRRFMRSLLRPVLKVIFSR